MITILAILLGAVIGSFLSVCIYRIPHSRPDIVDEPTEEGKEPASTPSKADPTLSVSNPPRSFCTSCKNQLLWWHNIPVVSWLILGGRCYFCKERISVRYPTVELLSAIAAVLSISVYGLSATALLIYAFVASLIVLSFIDYDWYILPNSITLPGAVIGFLVGAINHYTAIFSPPVSAGLMDALYGVLAGGGFLFFISEVYFRLRKKEGMGMGDVKLLAMIGAFFGPECALYTIFVGSLLGSILGVFLILFAGRRMSHQLPFGPYLAAATILYLFTSDQLVVWVSDLLYGGALAH